MIIETSIYSLYNPNSIYVRMAMSFGLVEQVGLQELRVPLRIPDNRNLELTVLKASYTGLNNYLYHV